MKDGDEGSVNLRPLKSTLGAAVLLWSALACFFAFHLLPAFPSYRPGWQVWRDIGATLLYSGLHLRPASMIVVTSFPTLAVLLLTSPVLVGIFHKSRLAWWLALLASVASSLGFWSFVASSSWMDDRLESGGWCLLVACFLNLAGLLSLALAKRSDSRPRVW